MRILSAILILLAGPLLAEIVVPTRTIRAREVIAARDLTLSKDDIPGAVADPELIVGKEARVSLYPGRPIRAADVGPPALIDRNDLVTLVYRAGRLTISAEGRALGRGGAGSAIRVMNLSSRMTVAGRVRPDGTVEVQK